LPSCQSACSTYGPHEPAYALCVVVSAFCIKMLAHLQAERQVREMHMCVDPAAWHDAAKPVVLMCCRLARTHRPHESAYALCVARCCMCDMLAHMKTQAAQQQGHPALLPWSVQQQSLYIPMTSDLLLCLTSQCHVTPCRYHAPKRTHQLMAAFDALHTSIHNSSRD
jgi:hypothetical protein